MSKAKSYGSVRPFGGKPQPLKEVESFISYAHRDAVISNRNMKRWRKQYEESYEFFPWEFVIFYGDVVQFCDFFGVDDGFNLEIPAFENMPDYV